MKLKFLILVLICVQAMLPAHAQNLVPNWSFEDTISCPKFQGFTFYSYTPPWFSPNINTPDIFNVCDDTTQITNVSVPKNWFGFQYPKTGFGYAGFATVYDNSQEYLSVKLYDSLAKNHKYCISFFVNVADRSPLGYNAIGLYLSKDSIFQNDYKRLNYTAQIQSSMTETITDTVNWIEISGEYNAGGGEKYITIGHFIPDALTLKDTVNTYNSVGSPYYFLDDVSIVDCTDTIVPPEDTNSLVIVNAFTPNNDGKNDYFHISGTNISTVHLKIINRWGQQLYEGMGENVKWDGKYNGNDVSPGVYYYIIEVTFEDGEVRNKAGSIHLIK
jgi:gliding motility-associated-like protein